MKYLIVTQTFPPKSGGMQTVMETISKKLATFEETHVFPDHFLKKNFNISNSNFYIHNNFTPKLLRHIVKKKLVAKIYEDNDIVICDSWKSINAVPEKVNKIIVFAHGQEYLATKKTNLIKKSLYRANHIISSSNYTLDLINNMNITEIKKSVIPPTYSLKATDENNIFKQPTKKVSILSITRLEERKGIIPVLKSLGYLHKEKLIKPFIWEICGEGNQETEIKNYIDNLGLSKHVKLLGRVSNEKKNQLLKKADLFVMPSYKVRNSIEGFGISYIEAASYGVPSIAGVEGGIRDAVFDMKTGWCVDPLNSSLLLDTIKEAINNESKREKFGLEAKKQFLKKFLGEKVFRKFMNTINS